MNMDSRKFLEKEPMVDKDEEKPNRKLNIQVRKKLFTNDPWP